MKTCSQCGQCKPLSEYSFGLAPDGRRYNCKKCQAEYSRQYRVKNPEKVARSSKMWKENNPGRTEHLNFKSHLKQTYGLTVEQYEQMVMAQGGKCAICGHPPDPASSIIKFRRLHVDHNHVTGKVRELLCHCCNAGIGHFEEDPSRLEAGAAYVRRHRNASLTI